MAYTAQEIASYIINYCNKDGIPISNLQLQKILYFCQEEYLSQTGSPLFDDDFEAWKYGPVIPSVYRRFSLYGGMKITRNCEQISLPSSITHIINPIIIEMRAKHPWELVEETHQDGTPWARTFCNGEGDGNIIDIAMIRR